MNKGTLWINSVIAEDHSFLLVLCSLGWNSCLLSYDFTANSSAYALLPFLLLSSAWMLCGSADDPPLVKEMLTSERSLGSAANARTAVWLESNGWYFFLQKINKCVRWRFFHTHGKFPSRRWQVPNKSLAFLVVLAWQLGRLLPILLQRTFTRYSRLLLVKDS